MTPLESLIKEAYFKDEPPRQVQVSDMQKIASALDKAASLPYKSETYEAACGMMKIASQALDELLKKNSDLEKLSEVRGIIDEMYERGMISKEDVHEKTSALMKKNNHELEVVREAIKLAGLGNSDNLFSSEPASSWTGTPYQREMFDKVNF